MSSNVICEPLRDAAGSSSPGCAASWFKGHSTSHQPERYVGYSTPSAEVVNGRVHLFYDVIAAKPSWQQVALHHAVSSDGVNFEEDPEALLRRNDVSWTKTEIRSPKALYKDGRFRLWFAGHDLGNLPAADIGYMDLKLP